MKRKILTLTLFLLTAIFTAEANPVDMRTIREVAVKFVNANSKTPLRSADGLQLVTTYNIDRGDAAFHIFNTSNGFVIVAADDCATPILGYSNEGQFELENIPVQLADYLDSFVEQIQYGVERRLTADEFIANQWESVRTYGTLYGSRATTNAVEPLLTSTWNQECYYNNLCPHGGPCGHALTGCVATAMGQIIRYLGYPANGNGSVTYTPSGYPQQSVNFMEAVYDYDNMPDYLDSSSDSIQIDAVAKLLWHCGVAVRARYGSSVTTAYSEHVPDALKNHFLYSSDLYAQAKDDVGNDAWLAQVKACLDLSRPVYYSGGGGAMNSIGHAFVCDGYDSNDLLHFNWGWGGFDDGYYALNALNPASLHLTSNQYAVFDIHPACNGETYQVSTPSSPSNGGTATGAGMYECGSVCTLTATANEGYRFYYWSQEGEQVSIDETYSFVVMDNTELVANFGSPIEITATSSPGEGGAVNGGGEYHYGHPCTLKAIPNEGYVFNSWTKDGEVVSYFSSYSFTVTGNAVYVANFQQADGIIIGDAEDDSYTLPTCSYLSLSQQIYTVEEMGGAACEISSVSFFNAYKYGSTHNITVYMVNTDKTAFESTTDWIAVTEADQVFKGHVTMAAKSWSTIYFNTPFMYDGSSNMALIVDDNSNTYVGTSEYRTFNTDERQAIYIYSANTNYDPYNPSSYSGGLVREKNQIILGLASYDYTVSAVAEPEEYGMVSGGGMYYYGQRCTLSAAANEGYCFYYWTENGTIVSYSTTYSFTVMNDRNLVANFGLPLNIVVATNSVEGGSVSGAGMYDYGSTCTITATANPGYVFTKWTKNGSTVSYLSDYSFNVTEACEYVAGFELVSPDIVVGQAQNENSSLPGNAYYRYSLSQQIYTMEEIGTACEISTISFYNTGYTKTRNYSVYLLHTDKCTFQSSTDWITVTEADKVFSGMVTLPSHAWATIALDTLFNYNGTSNLALIVDDNTGSYVDNIHQLMKCRVFNTDGYQSIVAISDDINYDPYNPSNCNGSLKLVKNQIILGVPSYDYTVTVTASPDEGGTVTGGGVCYHYQPITLTATANEGYVFGNWTKNGEVVSYASNYSINVTESAEYVAHFVSIPEGSIIIGSSETTNQNLPSHSYYRYALSQQIYTADEIGVAGTINSIAFYNGGAEETRVYDMYMVHTDKTVFSSNTDWITVTEAEKVFSGSVDMVANAWTFFVLDTPFEYDGTSNLVLVMDDNSGSYTGSPHMACRVFNANGNQAIRIYSDSPNYDPCNPSGYSGTRQTVKNQIILGITPSTVQQTIELSQGWNWVSTYIDLNEVDGITMLEEALGDYGVTIQTYNESADYFGDGEWSGLEDYEWTNAEMVMVEVSEDCTIDIAGPTVDPGTVEIEIHPGWNWIGFPVATETAIGVAMAGFEAEEEDAIQSNVDGTSDYLGEWVGDVLTLVPGQGYMYYSNSTEPKTLVFSTTAKGKSIILRKRKESFGNFNKKNLDN